jgi:hypothetical protein
MYGSHYEQNRRLLAVCTSLEFADPMVIQRKT